MSVWIWMMALAWAEPKGEPAPTDDVEEEEEVSVPDRTAPPTVRPPPRLELAEPEVHPLAPGVTVQLVNIQGIRNVSIAAVLHRGTYELAGGPTEAAQALGVQLDVATLSQDANDLEILRDLHEIQLTSWIGHHRGGVDLSCPKGELALGVQLLGEVLREPAFPKADLKRSQRFRELFYTVDGPSNLGWASQVAGGYGWHPSDHPYGARPVVGDIRKVRTKDLHELHQAWLEMSPVTVLVVGEVTWDEVRPLLESALEGLGAEGAQEPDLPIAAPSGTRVIGIDGPGDSQARIWMRTGAPMRDDADRVAADMAIWALGGHFLSRLNRNLREDKGFTYGSRAQYFTDETRGFVTVSVDVKVENVEATVTEIRAEIDALVAEGVTEDELDAAALEEISRWNDVKESARTSGRFYGSLLRNGESVADAKARGEAAIDIKVQDATRVAKDHLSADGTRLWVVAGDREGLAPQLEALGFEVEWITPEAAILGTF